MDPIEEIKNWLLQEGIQSNLEIKFTGCLSTIGLDGYPNSRFVVLKDIINGSFVITGSLNSRKGKELENCQKVSLTFWLPFIKKQIRIQGDVKKISDAQATQYFRKRNKSSQLIATIFNQGDTAKSFSELQSQMKQAKRSFLNLPIEKPIYWGGISIEPLRMELLEFKMNRLHNRVLFTRKQDKWTKEILQP